MGPLDSYQMQGGAGEGLVQGSDHWGLSYRTLFWVEHRKGLDFVPRVGKLARDSSGTP